MLDKAPQMASTIGINNTLGSWRGEAMTTMSLDDLGQHGM